MSFEHAERLLTEVYQPPDILIWDPVLKEILSQTPRFGELLDELKSRRFPDGTALIEGASNVTKVYDALRPYRLSIRFRENAEMRALRCFTNGKLDTRKVYKILISDNYFNAIGGEVGFGVVPSQYTQLEEIAGELCPERLLVRVRFWGGLDKARRLDFYRSIIAWGDSVAEVGIFGEGPAYVFPQTFLFNRHWASFQIDVSQSGQQTVHWLVLSVLNFSRTGEFAGLVRIGDKETAEDW